MNCLRVGCGGLLLHDNDPEAPPNSWKCAACSRRFYIAGSEPALCKTFGCRTKTTGGDYCHECAMRAIDRKLRIEKKAAPPMSKPLCKEPNCPRRTKGAYCYEHAIAHGWRSAVHSQEGDAQKKHAPIKTRGAWTPEERALRAQRVEENRKMRQSVQPIHEELEISEEPERKEVVNPDGGFPPITRPLPPAPPPPAPKFNPISAKELCAQGREPLASILEPFEVSFRIDKDAKSWMQFVARWRAAFPNHLIYSAYDSKEDSTKFIVNLRPEGE